MSARLSSTARALSLAGILAFATGAAQAATDATQPPAQTGDRLMITVTPAGIANAAFVPLRACGAEAPVALRFGDVRVDLPAEALHHLQMTDGSGEKHPVEKPYPVDSGCAADPLPVKSALLTKPIVVALFAPGGQDERGDAAVREAAAAGACTEDDGVRRCLARDGDRTSLTLSLLDADLPISAVCATTAADPPICRISGQAPDGPGYGVPIADGLVQEPSLIILLRDAHAALASLLKTEPSKP